MGNRCRFWALLCVQVTVAICCREQAHANGKFGFNYWPEKFTSNVFYKANWQNEKTTVVHDLDYMKSLGCKVVRLMFWPEQSGFTLEPDVDALSPAFFEMVANLPEFLGLLADRDMLAIVAFSNSFLIYGPDPVGPRWFNLKYGQSTNALAPLVRDSARWEQGIIQAFEESRWSKSVLYYDVQNEYSPDFALFDVYILRLVKALRLPAGKSGISILKGDLDLRALKSLAIDNALNFDFVDFHSYPVQPFNADIEGIYDSVKRTFPNALVLLGEFGFSASTKAEEFGQSRGIADVLNRAEQSKIPYFLNWGLYEQSMGPCAVRRSADVEKESAVVLRSRNDGSRSFLVF